MEQLQTGDIAELKTGGPKMTILSLDGSSGEAVCIWFEGKNRNEEILGSLKSQLTVSANPLAVVGWRCKPESL